MGKVWLGILLVVVVSLVVVSDEILDVYFIDVGQGDAILVDYGNWECLIDTGFQSAWPQNDEDWSLLTATICPPIDAFVLSHADRDHYSAFVLLASAFGIAQVIHGPVAASNAIVTELLSQLEAHDPQKQVLPGQVREVSASPSERLENMALDWRVLHPTSAFAAEEQEKNENSLVMSLTFGSVVFIFTGDVGTQGASQLANLEPVSERMILKVPHHGAKAGLALLALPGFDPEISIVSVGDSHSYGHPDQSLMEALAATSDVYVTTCGNRNGCLQSESFALEDYPSVFVDVGTVLVSTDGDSVWVTTSSLGRPTGQCSED